MKAFPGKKNNRANPEVNFNEGMDLRDYFAAKAMQGIIKQLASLEDYVHESEYTLSNNEFEKIVNKTSTIAYKFADSMMKKRIK